MRFIFKPPLLPTNQSLVLLTLALIALLVIVGSVTLTNIRSLERNLSNIRTELPKTIHRQTPQKPTTPPVIPTAFGQIETLVNASFLTVPAAISYQDNRMQITVPTQELFKQDKAELAGRHRRIMRDLTGVLIDAAKLQAVSATITIDSKDANELDRERAKFLVEEMLLRGMPVENVAGGMSFFGKGTATIALMLGASPIPTAQGMSLDYIYSLLNVKINEDSALAAQIALDNNESSRLIISLKTPAMFEEGRDSLTDNAQVTLFMISELLQRLNNKIQVIGYAEKDGISYNESLWRHTLDKTAAITQTLRENTGLPNLEAHIHVQPKSTALPDFNRIDVILSQYAENGV